MSAVVAETDADRAAEGLVATFRDGFHRSVAGAVVCDGPTALAVASRMTPEELSALRAAVEAHVRDFGGGADLFGGEALGGPVTVPLRGTVR
jgi:hypothetical protein